MSCDAPPSAEDLMQKKPRYDRQTRQCIKCKLHPGTLIIQHTIYCSLCLPPLLTRKLKRALSISLNGSLPTRSAHSPRPEAHDVVLALSGGPGSTVLLDVVTYLFPPTAKPKQGNKLDISSIRAVHIDWSGLAGPSLVEPLQARCTELGVELTVVRGESAFDPSFWPGGGSASVDLSGEGLPLVLPEPSERQEPIDALRTYLSHLPSPSSLPPTLSLLTRLLLSHTALSLSPPSAIILTGTSLPRLSISLFDTLSSGGGFALGSEREELVGGEGSGGVRVLRPLREWSAKEVGWWIHHRRLLVPRPIHGKPLPSLSLHSSKTITKLTEDFVMRLERDYPSTVNAISRTCGKVVPTDEPSHICSLCARPAQQNASGYKSRTAILSLSLYPSPPPPPRGNLSETLCYACLTHLTSRAGVGSKRLALPVARGRGQGRGRVGAGKGEGEGDGDGDGGIQMPVWVGRRLGEGGMRGMVGGFLLGDEEG